LGHERAEQRMWRRSCNCEQRKGRRNLVILGDREPGRITIVEYDLAWPHRFEEERRRITRVLGTSALRIEHIGSTSVPSLAAKPIVDILVEVRQVEDEDAYRRRLEDSGYVLRVREPEHRMFRTPAKDVHVHLWSAPDEIERHLTFRDWLRRNQADRQLYERTKRELAGRRWKDMNAYADAKSGVIAEIMARASRRAAPPAQAPGGGRPSAR
jgi:GrpB-like predicted nucleotidyltransferase (UPF0157 family)